MHNASTMHPKKIAIIDLGGTITSQSQNPTDEFYQPPSLTIEMLCKKLPLPKQLNLAFYCPFKLLSQDITEKNLLELAQLITELAATDVDGIVVAMGTNAAEEVSFFIHITIKTEKPIVFTGSIRQANALGHEGERNLYHAILLAAEDYRGFGVLLCFNDVIYSARDFIKLNPSLINAFDSNLSGPIGYVIGEQIKLSYRPNGIHTVTTPFDLKKINNPFPKVSIIYGTLGDDSFLIDAAIANNVAGIISAGLGKGYQPAALTNALHHAVKQGIVVVRCSRTGLGVVHMDKNTDEKLGFIPGQGFSPAKAKILLTVALCHTQDKRTIQDIFNHF